MLNFITLTIFIVKLNDPQTPLNLMPLLLLNLLRKQNEPMRQENNWSC